jgi:hypothetical protein
MGFIQCVHKLRNSWNTTVPECGTGIAEQGSENLTDTFIATATKERRGSGEPLIFFV